MPIHDGPYTNSEWGLFFENEIDEIRQWLRADKAQSGSKRQVNALKAEPGDDEPVVDATAHAGDQNSKHHSLVVYCRFEAHLMRERYKVRVVLTVAEAATECRKIRDLRHDLALARITRKDRTCGTVAEGRKRGEKGAYAH